MSRANGSASSRVRSTRDRPAREATICDAAIEVIVARGLRGLTHRAVDEGAGLPPGSTSYYFRTRLRLLTALVDRLAELSATGVPRPTGDRNHGGGTAPEPAPPRSLDELAELLTDRLHHALTDGRSTTLARYELSLEATRRPELRRRLEEAGSTFRTSASALLTELGATDPQHQGRQLVAWCDGMLYDTLVGAGTGHPPDRAQLAAAVRDLLRRLLPAR